MNDSRREQLERELRELDEAERGSAGTVEPAQDPDACPNCGGSFVRAPRFDLNRRRDDVDPRSRQRFIDARKALDAERGELQQCQGCGYQRRAHDKIERAKVA